MDTYQRIEKVIHFLEKNFQQQPSNKELAKVAGVSEFHFHRLFTKWAGVTPKHFLKFLTIKNAKLLLQESRDLLNTSLESGLSGPGRLHDLFVSVDAVSPGEFKSKGKGITIEYGFHSSPFGPFLIGITKRGICCLSFTENLNDLKSKWPNAKIVENQKGTSNIAKKIFDQKSKTKIPLLLMGTPFQLKVWEALINIPDGHLLSYSDVAKMINLPNASRAVGTAIGRNAIAYLIPCHRVIRDSGEFSNYRWDPNRKKAMLVWESSQHQGKNL